MACKLDNFNSDGVDLLPPHNIDLPELPKVSIGSMDMEIQRRETGRLILNFCAKERTEIFDYLTISMHIGYKNKADMFQNSEEAAIRAAISHLQNLLK